MKLGKRPPSKQQGGEWLRSVPLFSGLSQRDVSTLWSNMKLVHHDDGVQIAEEGKHGVGLHLIVSGQAQVSRRNLKVMLHAGDVFGEMSLIDDGPRSATVTAIGEVTTATITSWAFKSFAIERPELLWKMLVFQTARLRAEQKLSANLTA